MKRQFSDTEHHAHVAEGNIFQAAGWGGKIRTEPSGFLKSGKTRVCRAEYQRGETYSESRLVKVSLSLQVLAY